MEDSFKKDVSLTHTVLNFIHAELQGAFAECNMLSQLGFHDFNPDSISQLEKDIELTERWLEELYKGVPIFSTSWEGPQTIEAKEAFQLVTEIRKELIKKSGKIKKILVEDALSEHPEDVKFLIGALTRNAYKRDHSAHGLIELAKFFQDEAAIPQFNPLVQEAQRQIEGSHLLFSIYTQDESPQPIFFKGLLDEAHFLPGAFRTYAHEALLLVHTYKKNLSYKEVEIPDADAQGWSSLSISPAYAGFWHAYLISPAQTQEWVRSAINQPGEAWFWSHLKFIPQEAASWRMYGFSPVAAATLRSQGKEPALASEEIMIQIRKQEEAALRQAHDQDDSSE